MNGATKVEKVETGERGTFRFYSRHFRTELHKRLKVLAAKSGTTIEQLHNRVVEVGLPIVEKERR